MTSSQTPLTKMSAVPTSKMATKSTLMTSSSTLAKSTMLKIKSFQDLTFRLVETQVAVSLQQWRYVVSGVAVHKPNAH